MISWIISGKETELDDRENIYLLNTDGFGMPAFHRFEERGPLQHGVTDRGYRLDARIVILVLGIRGDDLDDFYQRRTDLINAFRPSDTAGRLRWTQGSLVRQVDGHLISGLEWSDKDRSYLFQKASVVIKCPDPTWYNPQGRLVGFSIGGGSDKFEVPMVVPMTVGVSSIDDSQIINYSGSVSTFPVISITGPITNCVITNSTLGLKLDFTGYTIPADTTYTIDLRYGHKTITDQNGNNQISKLTDDSDLATWRLEADPEALNGVNSIHVRGNAITENTEINLQFFERYIGV